MANTHEVLQGVKDYTLELLGTKARDEAVDAADRAEAQAERAEAAADNAEVGIRDNSVAKQHLTPGLRGEVDGKADEGHTHTSADITNAYHYLGEAAYAHRVVKTHDNGHIYMRTDPPSADALARKAYVDGEVAKKADQQATEQALAGKADKTHTHTAQDVGARPDTWTPTAQDVGARPDTWTPTAAQVGARPDTWTPTAAQVGAATPGYVDSRIQLVTSWPASPVAGVLYLMEEG